MALLLIISLRQKLSSRRELLLPHPPPRIQIWYWAIKDAGPGSDHDAAASRGASGSGDIPSVPQLVLFIEPSPQPNDDTTFADSHLPVESSASVIKENP
jgi:hypothetical protein